MRLAAQAELFDQGLVASIVVLLEVVEKAATGRNQLEQAAAGMVILAMVLEVLGEVGNTFAEDRDLDFRRTGIVGLGCVFPDQLGLAFCGNRQRAYPFKKGGRWPPQPGCRPGGAK